MRTANLALAVLLSSTAIANGEERDPPRPITVAEIYERTIIGHLGISLGTVAEIETEVVAGRELRSKYYSNRYLLRIHKVDDQTLERPVMMVFSVFPAVNTTNIGLARNSFELHRLKTDKKARSLNTEQITELEKGYVGKRMRFYAYETGRFDGLPHNLPPTVNIWQDRGFGFHTHLIVLDRIAPADNLNKDRSDQAVSDDTDEGQSISED